MQFMLGCGSEFPPALQHNSNERNLESVSHDFDLMDLYRNRGSMTSPKESDITFGENVCWRVTQE